jgi:2-hydroxychromene-2-carboxylate isomerase
VKQVTCYLDVISPYAYLAFEREPEALLGLNCRVEYRPVLFAAFLKHHGQLGPAEIAPKREWTYRQVLWLGHTLGIPLDLPASHPFNPLALLRLALACGESGAIDRRTAQAVFHHVWRAAGAEAAEPQRLGALQRALAPARDPASEEVKAELRANTDAALARGAFGVPSYAVDDQLFWGLDALPVLRAWLQGDPWFSAGPWQAAGRVGSGAVRSRG